jgi:hypothetical protein
VQHRRHDYYAGGQCRGDEPAPGGNRPPRLALPDNIVLLPLPPTHPN